MTTSHLKKYCILNEECQRLIKSAIESMHLSARAYDRIRKVVRTIADLDC
ncbi:MAG: hypothetical protein N3D17_06940 [bacterium]|nr:hypothetical protein [bacterium]